jgi:hypothetical protein
MIPHRHSDQIQSNDDGARQELPHRIGRWASILVVPAISLLLGLAYAVAVVGPRVSNPFNVSWLVGDPATAYLGWAFFRREPHLELPLGWAGAIGYPLGEPVAYFDAIPLIATIGWLVRNVIPQDFQYFGAYFALCCILQFYFGYRISRRICRGSDLAGLLGGALFLTAPSFTWQAFGHFALGSHWIILASLDEFFAASVRPSRGRIVWRAVLCFLAGAISPYITAMVLLVFSGTYLRTILCQRKCVLSSTIGAAFVLCAGIWSLMLFGFIRTADSSQYAGGGYELYSMNLLAPIDPESYGALVLKPQPIGPGQSAGYNYLGLGLLLTGAVSIIRRPTNLCFFRSLKAVPAIAIFTISLLLALSSLATVGSYVLYHVAPPAPLLAALTSFRASGRLFWPGYYLLISGILASASYSFRGQWVCVSLAAALALQWVDLAPLRAMIHDQWRTSMAPLVSQDPQWNELGRRHKHLVVVPAWQCSIENTPAGYDGYAIFGRLALEQNMTINSFYAGRYSDAQLAVFCDEQVSNLLRDGLRSDTAYVFKPSMALGLAGLHLNGEFCRYLDQYLVCSNVHGLSGLDPAVSSISGALKSGASVSFSGQELDEEKLIGLGWSGREPWGRWIIGHTATIAFRVDRRQADDIRIDFSIIPFLSSRLLAQQVSVLSQGELLSQQTFAKDKLETLKVIVPTRLIDDTGLIRLEFRLPDAASPASLGLSADQRLLSIGVKKFDIEDADGQRSLAP